MNGRFAILDTPLQGLQLIQRQPIGDDRGYLERIFCGDELSSLMRGKSVVQVNHTLTARRGTVRGMHFQYPPHSETKIVSCLHGEVFDVAVDLRRSSPTFLHWHGELLSASNHKTLLIPDGFAHGFQTMTDECQMLYLHTAAYRPSSEGGLNIFDPRICIRWPADVVEISPRDSSHAMLDDSFVGVPG